MLALVRRHRLATFFLLTFVLSWWSWPFWAVGLAPVAHWALGPLVAALIVIGLTEGRAGYLDMLSRLVRWRVGWPVWLAAIGLPLAVLALAALANVTIWGAAAPDLAGLAWGDLALVAAMRLVNPLDGPLGEEPGFRAYALPRMQATRTPLVTAAILGPVVALWHLPLVVTGQLAAIGLAITVAITVVYVWLFDHSRGSLLVVLVFHVLQGTVSYAALGFTGADAARMDWITGALWVLLAIGLVAADRSLRRPAPAEAVVVAPREPAAVG